MPLLTRDLPRGGRHVSPPPAAAPVPSASTRMRQLLPVGLLVAAASAGAAVTPVIGDAASADAGHGDTTPTTSTSQAHVTPSPAARPITPGTDLSPASYALPHHARHRATVLGEPLPTSVAGKHRATGSPVASQAAPDSTAHKPAGDAPSAAPSSAASSSAGSSSAGTGATPTTQGSAAAKASATTGGTASATSSSSAPSSSTPATGSSSATPSGNLVTDLLGTVGGVVHGVLGGGSD